MERPHGFCTFLLIKRPRNPFGQGPLTTPRPCLRWKQTYGGSEPAGPCPGWAAALPRSRCAPASLLAAGMGQLAGASELLKPAGREASGSGPRASPRGRWDPWWTPRCCQRRKGKTDLLGKHSPRGGEAGTRRRSSHCFVSSQAEMSPKSYSVCACSLQAAPEILPKALKSCSIATN